MPNAEATTTQIAGCLFDNDMCIAAAISEAVDRYSMGSSRFPWLGRQLNLEFVIERRQYCFLNEKHTFKFHSCSGIREFTFSKLRLGKIIRFSSINTALITPATPLAPSRWPTFVLIDPMRSG